MQQVHVHAVTFYNVMLTPGKFGSSEHSQLVTA